MKLIKIAALSLTLFSTISLYSQEYSLASRFFPRYPVTNWNVGIFGGLSDNALDIDVAYAADLKYSASSGFSAGIAASHYPVGWFSLRSGVAMLQKNWHLERNNDRVKAVYTDATNNYLSIPLTAEVSLGRKVRLCGVFGGYVGYWLSGHRVGKSLSVTNLITYDEDDMLFDEAYHFSTTRDNRFEAGLTYGLALRCTVARRLDISAELRWWYGLTDLQKDYMQNILPRYNDTRTITLGLAYWLKVKG